MKRKKENYKKAQAAMEFLMTYGWAVLIVIIVIGTLAYFGVLKLSRFLPQSCFLMPGLSCEEFVVTPEGVVLFVRNGMGKDLNSISIIVVGSGDDKCVGASAPSISLANDGLGRFNIYCTEGMPVEDSRFVSDLLISYSHGGLTHNRKGRLVTFVQGLSGDKGKADEDICKRYQDDGICGALNIVYGKGYRNDGCCEFGLCCTIPCCDENSPVPCCGDGVCSDGETLDTCLEDCICLEDNCM